MKKKVKVPDILGPYVAALISIALNPTNKANELRKIAMKALDWHDKKGKKK